MAGLLMLPMRRIKVNIALLSLQALFLSIIAFSEGLGSAFEWHSVAIGLLTLLVKVIALPLILLRLVNSLQADQEKDMSAGPIVSMTIGLLIVGLTFGYIVPVLLQDIRVGHDLLGAAVATILFGCFFVVSRRCVLHQVLGIVVMENGLFLSALAITGGMPIMIELGIFFDVLVGVLVMGAIIYKISDSFKSLDIKRLNRLRG
ncbi:MAG: hypothetical protein GX434_17615 [Peptococcaceae bacterium]|nr:hypothetical protein [Peptococcaceae bacterium]